MAITMDSETHAKVLDAAAEAGTSASAWLTAAARRELRVRDGLDAVAEWEAEHGALTREELQSARARLANRSSKQRRSRK